MAVQSIPSHCWFVKQLIPTGGGLVAIDCKTVHMFRLGTSTVGVGVGMFAVEPVISWNIGRNVDGERRD